MNVEPVIQHIFLYYKTQLRWEMLFHFVPIFNIKFLVYFLLSLKKCIFNKMVENVCGYSVSRKFRSCNPGSYCFGIHKRRNWQSGPIELVLLQLLNNTDLSIFGTVKFFLETFSCDARFFLKSRCLHFFDNINQVNPDSS